MLGPVSTWMGDRLGTPDAVGILLLFFSCAIRLGESDGGVRLFLGPLGAEPGALESGTHLY